MKQLMEKVKITTDPTYSVETIMNKSFIYNISFIFT